MKKEQLLMNGELLRIAALSHTVAGQERVKVIFKSKDSEYAYWMSPETYHAYPLLKNVTLSDYKSKGEVIPALNTDIYSID